MCEQTTTVEEYENFFDAIVYALFRDDLFYMNGVPYVL